MPAPEDTPSSPAGARRTAVRKAAPAPRRTPRRSAATPPAVTYADRPWLASYPEGVPADYVFPSIPLTRLLDDAASSFPTRTALAFLGTTLTYRELTTAVDAFASGLRGLGVGKGDRVAIVLPNCPQNVIAFFATLRLGAIVVQHNPLYTETELRHQLADCGASVVVCLDRVYETVAKVRADTELTHVVVTSIADYLPRAARLKLRLPVKKARKARAEITAQLPKGAPVTQFTALLKTPDPARQVEVDPENDLALLQYTGGTTGLSKGAMLTHHNLVSNAYMNRLWDTGATAGKEVTLGVLPLFHAYGLTVCMNATVLLGGTLVLLPRFDLDQVFAAIDEHKPTMFPGVPPIYKALTDSPKARSHDLRSIRLCVSGAMKLPVEVQEQFEKISGARVVEGYGMTETSPSTHCNPLTGDRRPGSIGLPLPGTLCKVVDQDNATREMPIGEAGELAIKGPQVFRGYWNREDAGGVFTDDGYLLTGDVATMDTDGYFAIVDRKKELIIAGGFNIYPSEVEEVLFRLPGVADAVVVGVPDTYRGETVKAFVVAATGVTLTEADVIEYCRTQLSAYKVPKLVEFRDDLPRTVVGKVLRRVLVEQERAKAEQSKQPVPASTPGGREWSGADREKSPQSGVSDAMVATQGVTGQVAAERVGRKAQPAPPVKARVRPAVLPVVTPPVTEDVPEVPEVPDVSDAPDVSTSPASTAPVRQAPARKAAAKKTAPAKAAPAKTAPAEAAANQPAPVKAVPAKTAAAKKAAPVRKPAVRKAAPAKPAVRVPEPAPAPPAAPSSSAVKAPARKSSPNRVPPVKAPPGTTVAPPASELETTVDGPLTTALIGGDPTGDTLSPAPAKKAPAKKAPAKKAPAKKAPAKKAAVKKVAGTTPPARKSPAAPERSD